MHLAKMQGRKTLDMWIEKAQAQVIATRLLCNSADLSATSVWFIRRDINVSNR